MNQKLIVGLLLIASCLFAATDDTSETTVKKWTGSPLQFGLDLQYYAPVYKKYAYAIDGAGQANTSDQSGRAAQISFEWLPFGNEIGKLGIGVSSGFVGVTNASITQSYGGQLYTRAVNLFVIPSQFFISYRLDYFTNQLIVPFAKIGGSANWVRQVVEGGDDYHMTYGVDYSVGGELCLNAFEPKAGRLFDAQFGVNGTYLVFDYTRSDPFNSTSALNLSYEAVRFGMRFEF